MSVAPAHAEPVDALLRDLCDRFRLDLAGLVIYTEAASGTYLHTPVLAALGGAEHVYALARDSSYAPAADVRRATEEAAGRFGVADRVEVVDAKIEAHVAAADVILNTGFVRPIDAAMVAWMKPTAVVPLMWETWEFRPDELDLAACRERGILVLGTDENVPPLAMYRYSGELALALLEKLGVDASGARVLLLGAQPPLGGSIHARLRETGTETGWFGAEAGENQSYDALASHFAEDGGRYDAIIVAEHHDPRRVLGAGGILDWPLIREANPTVRIGVIAGEVDAPGLADSGLRHEPATLRPFGYMSFPTCVLGPRPVLELFAGGLLVGQVMARARLRGLGATDAARYALDHAPAMDFIGDAAWL